MSSEHEVSISQTVVNGLPSNNHVQDKDVDPSKVCTGKGAVTLRASVTCDDLPSSSIQPSQDDRLSPDDWKPPPSTEPNGEGIGSSLAAKGYRSVRPTLSDDIKAQSQGTFSEVKEGLPSTTNAESQPSFTSLGKPSSVYPSTTIVNPTIVLLQHNREQQKRLSNLADSVPDKSSDFKLRSPVGQEHFHAFNNLPSDRVDMDGRRAKVPAGFSLINNSSMDEMGIPLRNTEKSKEWYKNMFKQIHKLTKDDDSDSYSPRYSYSEDMKTQTQVPRSRSAMDNSTESEIIVKRSATLPLPTRSSSLKPAFERNNWEPPDKKVDTRKYRAEPKSIFEYEPGRSSVLVHDKTGTAVNPHLSPHCFLL